jgi:RNA polymerase sigma-70 factor (TIGR02960 family)
MNSATRSPIGADEEQFMAAARADDAATFALLTERYRRALHVHCYRMLASYEDAQDITQETFMRAWDRRQSFQGRGPLSGWLYRIATNSCLDFLAKRRDRMPVPTENPEGGTEVLYLQPFPDDPQDAAIARETIELAFIVAVQHLPPRQRAVLIFRDVLGWPARRTADALEMSLASTNSALQRAREAMRRHLPQERLDWRSPTRRGLTAAEKLLVDQYISAQESLDIPRLTALLRDDLRSSMPPQVGVFTTRESALHTWVEEGFGKPPYVDWRCLPTTANGQPAVAAYLRWPGDTVYKAVAIDVLRIVDGLVAEITTFGPEPFEWLGLPDSL